MRRGRISKRSSGSTGSGCTSLGAGGRCNGLPTATSRTPDGFYVSEQRYDLILDTKTNRSTFRYLRSLNPDGRYVTVGGHLPRLLQACAWRRSFPRSAGSRFVSLG